MLWCPLRFPHKNDIRFVFTPSCLLCLVYIIVFVCAWGAQCALTNWVAWRVSCKRQEMLTLHEHLGFFQVFSVVLSWIFFCVVIELLWFVCLRPLSCVPIVASVSYVYLQPAFISSFAFYFSKTTSGWFFEGTVSCNRNCLISITSGSE